MAGDDLVIADAHLAQRFPLAALKPPARAACRAVSSPPTAVTFAVDVEAAAAEAFFARIVIGAEAHAAGGTCGFVHCA